MIIHLSNHLKLVAKERRISLKTVKAVLKKPDQIYFDASKNRLIAVGHKEHLGHTRPIIVPFDKKESELTGVTVYTCNETEIKQRLSTRRWQNEN